MCGQFEAALYLNYLKNTLHLPDAPDQVEFGQPSRVVPTGGAPIVIENPESGRLEVIPARFGLIPHWYSGALKDWKATTFNARLDTVTEKRVFQGAWKYRHAVVPADCFYEWSGEKNTRRKWRITRADNQPLAFAGLWDCANLAEGEIWSFTLLTRNAGRDMAPIHDREPVILAPDQWDDWLRRRPVDLAAPVSLRLQAETPVAPVQGSLF